MTKKSEKIKDKKCQELLNAIIEVEKSVEDLEGFYGSAKYVFISHFYPLISVIETTLTTIKEKVEEQNKRKTSE